MSSEEMTVAGNQNRKAALNDRLVETLAIILALRYTPKGKRQFKSLITQFCTPSHCQIPSKHHVILIPEKVSVRKLRRKIG